MKAERIDMKRIFFSLTLLLFLACPVFAAQQAVNAVGPTTSALDLRTKINAAFSTIQSNFTALFSATNNTLELTVQEPLAFDNATGVLSLSGGAGVSYLSTDPSLPSVGEAWYNYTDGVLRIAASDGIKNFGASNTTAWDTTPAAFSFTDVTNATTNSTYTSNAITVSGINWPAPISVSGDASAKYSVNNATATSVNGTVVSGDEVRAVVTSSADAGADVNATVTIGGVSDAYVVTTAAEAGGGGDYTYVGWANTEGVPTGTPSSASTANTGFVAVDKWIATESGSINAVQAYVSTIAGTPTFCSVVVYGWIDSGIKLIGYGNASISETGWSGFIPITAIDGRSLSFVSDDSIYFGVAYSSGTGGAYGREDTGGAGVRYQQNLTSFSTPPTTLSTSTSSDRIPAFILRYE